MMAAVVSVHSLPCEVLEHILEDENIHISDVMSFALTCKELYRTVTTSNRIWKTKFLRRWPYLREAFEEIGANSRNESPVWREETKERILCRRRLMEKLSQMSPKHYGKGKLAHSELREYDPLFLPECGAHRMNYDYLIDELVTLLESNDANLTYKHWAYHIVRYVRQTHLAKEWQKFLALPMERQTTERVAILVAQWSQPRKRVSARRVSEMLDDIAQQTRILVAERYPTIPINLVPRSELNRWKNENLYDNQWSNEDSRIIVTTLCEIMFNTLGFHGNSEMHYSSVNSFIDHVLKHERGIPITLAIVFESVARRLGLHCETVSFPAHFLLRWKERYIPNVKEDEDVESYYIDVLNGGQFLTRNSCSGIAGATRCPIEKHNVHQATSPVKVAERMANNLLVAGRQRSQFHGQDADLCSALELLNMVKPHDLTTISSLANFYTSYDMECIDLMKTLNEMLIAAEGDKGLMWHIEKNMKMILDHEKQKELNLRPPKTRPAGVKYVIGMIMKDTLSNRCVITDWKINLDFCSPEFDRQRNERGYVTIDSIRKPFYRVCFEDGTCRWVTQETLSCAATPEPVNHVEIGYHFYKFTGICYLPNEEKAKEYPEDEKIRNRIFAAIGIRHNK